MSGAVTNLKTVASLEVGRQEVKQVLDGLGDVWSAFDSQMNSVPIIQRLQGNTLTMEDYRALLLTLRHQVVDGSRWIAVAAANISEDFLDLRSKFLRHAVSEHRDYQLIEDDFIAAGGTLNDIHFAERNIGSEALTAYLLQKSAKSDPFSLLGAMYILEGIGAFKALGWARAIRETLKLAPERPGFLIHHGEYDGDHMEDFEIILGRVATTPRLRRDIIKTARVVARLYILQLESIETPCI